jgi:hypothetical protein
MEEEIMWRNPHTAQPTRREVLLALGAALEEIAQATTLLPM